MRPPLLLHPWIFALGIAAAALPVAIHFLTKPRPLRMPLSTLRFVREVTRQRRARHRLRDLLVLLLRTSAVLLAALALARPRWSEPPAVSDSRGGAAVRAVVLDVSQSMAAVRNGATALERARAVADAYLRYRPGLRANLLLAGASPRSVFPEASVNFEALRRELANVRAAPERLDANRALAAAADLLTSAAPDQNARRELVVISDFQRSNWARADFSALPAGARIELESVAGRETPANLALLGAGIRGRINRSEPARLEVEVGNFSAGPRRVTVEAVLGDAAYRLEGTCPAGRRTVLSDEVQIDQLGWLAGHARLFDVTDALEADDSRPLVVQVSGQPRYALITRQLDKQRPSASHFVSCALAPDARLGERASATVLRMHPDQADRQSLAAADLIVMDHPGKLSPDMLQYLAGLMRRGRSILYVAAEPIDATNLKLLAESAGGRRLPVEFLPPPVGQIRRDLFLTSVRRDAAPFHVFGENTAEIVGRLRFGGGLNSRNLPGALQDELVAAYNDGSACLVLSSPQPGMLAVLNADLAQSNLPTTEFFVPLWDEVVNSLLAPGAAAAQPVCGETLLVRLPASAGSEAELRIVGPAGDAGGEAYGELTSDASGAVWHWPAPNRVGVYRVERGGTTVCAVPVAMAPEESQLESLPPTTLENRLAAGRVVHVRAAQANDERRDDSWTWLLIACTGCLLAELVTLAVLRS